MTLLENRSMLLLILSLMIQCYTITVVTSAIEPGILEAQSYSFMHMKSVLTTLPDRSAAAYPCFTSSVNAKAPAPIPPAAVSTTVFLLLSLFRALGAFEENETF
jgi:hypothetical protein